MVNKNEGGSSEDGALIDFDLIAQGARPFFFVNDERYELDIGMAPLQQRFGLRARLVLEDARKAHEILEATEDMTIARIQYFALIALLRAVGHVLDKVDSADPDVKKISTRKYQQMKEDPESFPIFWEFIDAERNLIVKEYKSNAELTTPVPIIFRPSDGSRTVAEQFTPFPMFVFEDGPFDGEDARDVAVQALDFWDEYLSEIETTCFKGEASPGA